MIFTSGNDPLSIGINDGRQKGKARLVVKKETPS